ncbi:MAG: glycosyltransferase family 87 protein [Xanthobacteraceae bacterium]|uniref:glycosyltransferase family 87 protein n=1 Tax=Pseudolabrys sp. TaxID=1960880 RepID=UPI003D0C6B40
MSEPATTPAARIVTLAGLTLALAFLVVLAGAYLNGNWLFDEAGRPIANDFVNVFAAGKLALEGHAAAAYDWTVHKATEVQAVGYDFGSYYGWHYPPTFLIAAATLALLPYTAAALAALAVTLPLYAMTIRGIAGDRAGWFLALGFPAALWNVTAGQNGFLTAALIGGTLLFIERRPVLAGVLLGLLTYKPHFGLLFPFALIAGGYWRVLSAASLTAFCMIAASVAVFGGETWIAFARWMPVTSHVVLGEGGADFDRLQSLFGLVRALGGGMTLAWTAQGAVALAALGGVCALWRSRAPSALKAAALSCGALLATPYLYMYDLVALAVPVAFLVRIGLARGFARAEAMMLPAGAALLLIYPYVKTQVGLAATVIVAALIVLRVKDFSFRAA